MGIDTRERLRDVTLLAILVQTPFAISLLLGPHSAYGYPGYIFYFLFAVQLIGSVFPTLGMGPAVILI